MRNIFKVWGKAVKSGDLEKVCGLNKCKGLWVEEALTVLVVIAQIRGWKVDSGLMDRWIQSIIKQERIAAEKARNKDPAEQMEKGEVVVEEVFVDAEKRELMARDEVMAAAESEKNDEVLIDIEQEEEVVEKTEELKA